MAVAVNTLKDREQLHNETFHPSCNNHPHNIGTSSKTCELKASIDALISSLLYRYIPKFKSVVVMSMQRHGIKAFQTADISLEVDVDVSLRVQM